MHKQHDKNKIIDLIAHDIHFNGFKVYTSIFQYFILTILFGS
jgi:hypothetical protein